MIGTAPTDAPDGETTAPRDDETVTSDDWQHVRVGAATVAVPGNWDVISAPDAILPTHWCVDVPSRPTVYAAAGMEGVYDEDGGPGDCDVEAMHLAPDLLVATQIGQAITPVTGDPVTVNGIAGDHRTTGWGPGLPVGVLYLFPEVDLQLHFVTRDPTGFQPTIDAILATLQRR